MTYSPDYDLPSLVLDALGCCVVCKELPDRQGLCACDTMGDIPKDALVTPAVHEALAKVKAEMFPWSTQLATLVKQERARMQDCVACGSDLWLLHPHCGCAPRDDDGTPITETVLCHKHGPVGFVRVCGECGEQR